MCFYFYHSCACGTTLNSTTSACEGARLLPNFLRNMELGESANLGPWDPKEPVTEHTVCVRRAYEATCECGHGIVQEGAAGTAKLFRSSGSASPKAIVPPTITHDGETFNLFTIAGQVFILFGFCGHQVDRQEWENCIQLNRRANNMSETMEYRSYIVHGPSCKSCAALKENNHKSHTTGVNPKQTQFEATAEATIAQEIDIDDVMKRMGGLDMNRWQVGDLADAMGVVKIDNTMNNQKHRVNQKLKRAVERGEEDLPQYQRMYLPGLQ